MPFTQEYLKDYEEKIRQLPLEELYDIISLIRDDPIKADDTQERVRIVEKRIEELENSPAAVDPVEELNEKLETEYQKKPHLLSFILKAVAFILLIIGIINFLLANDTSINKSALVTGIATILIMYAELLDKRVSGRGGNYHKEAHPFIYWSEIAFLFIAGVAGIFYGVQPFLQ